MNAQEHWNRVYATKRDDELSWTQSEPHTSLSLIREWCPRGGSIVDVGGGASALHGRLLDAGYSVTVVDISEAALARARAALGSRAAQVRWVAANITASPDLRTHDVWHDRAVYHFLTEAGERSRYVELMYRTLCVNGIAVIATFAEDGPPKCSGLPVCRYSGPALAAELGDKLQLVSTMREMHLTPWGQPQSFQYSVFRRRG